MLEPLDVLAIFAHPDDAELLCGGALARSSDAGERTGILDLTRGEMGTRGTPEIRAAEAAEAAEVLGCAVRENAGLPDADLRNDRGARVAVAGWLRRLRPRVVVTHWTEGRHPDHRITAELVHDACFLAGLVNFPAEGERHRPEKLVHALSFREDAPRPTFVVDITRQIDRKVEAMACYRSQFEGNTAAGEVYPGGDRGLFDQVRAHAAATGSRIRCPYGEAFWTRETVRKETLGGVDVPTF